MSHYISISGYATFLIKNIFKGHSCAESKQKLMMCVIVETCVCTLAKNALSYADMPSRIFGPPRFFWSQLWHVLASLRCAKTCLYFPFTFRPLHAVRVHLLSYAGDKNDIYTRGKIAMTPAVMALRRA